MRALPCIGWVLLLIAPGIAVAKLGAVVEPWMILSDVVIVNLATYVAYAVDKRRAQRGAWRVPEATLHALELLGGWPAAFLAQQRLRHKTQKPGFQAVFWLIVLVHQYLAIDYANDWRWFRLIAESGQV